MFSCQPLLYNGAFITFKLEDMNNRLPLIIPDGCGSVNAGYPKPIGGIESEHLMFE